MANMDKFFLYNELWQFCKYTFVPYHVITLYPLQSAILQYYHIRHVNLTALIALIPGIYWMMSSYFLSASLNLQNHQSD